MRARKISVSFLVGTVGIAASFLLITALASAQRGLALPPPSAQERGNAQPLGGLSSAQALSVTFPPGPWPWYAQEEISVRPEPPVPGRPTELCAEVVNQDPGNSYTVTLEFSVARFGIGVPFMPVGQTDVIVPPGGGARGCVIWVPPDPGHWCIQAAIKVGRYEPLISQRNIDIWEPLVPNEPHDLVFPVGPMPAEGHVTFTLVNHMGWNVELIPPEIPILQPDQEVMVTLRTTPPPTAVLGTRQPVVDVEGFLNGEPIGGFRKLDWPPVQLHRDREPFFAESEIHVWPYPPRAGEPTEICVELYNSSDFTQTTEVLLSWANFGIGLPFDPIDGPIVIQIPPRSHEMVCITWVPPQPGHFCIQVMLKILGDIPYQPQFSQRNLDVAEPLKPGIGHVTEFRVGNYPNEFTNPEPILTDIWLTADTHLPGWEVRFDPPVLPPVAPEPEDARWVTMIVTPPLGVPLPPPDTPLVDVRAWVDDPLAGPRVIGGFRKVFRPPVLLHRFPDPPYAEREITIHPYPPREGEPTEICVELYNPTSEPQDVTLFFSWANFGIGLPFTNIGGSHLVHLPPFSMVRECIHWIPPVGGHVCLRVDLEMEGYRPQWSQRNIDVDEPLRAGQPHHKRIRIGSWPYEEPVTITLGLVRHVPEDWIIELTPRMLTDVGTGLDAESEITLTVTPPEGVPLPPDGTPIVDVEAFVRGELLGGIRKIFRPPVPLHPFPDPPYAEREITIEPYPPRAGEPTEVCVELRNPTPEPQDVTVFFSWANFGIGLPFQPINGPRVVHLPPHSIVRECIHWIPPISGHICLKVDLEMPEHPPQWSQRNIDVNEPLVAGEPHTLWFPVGNPFDHPVTITLGLVPHLPGWKPALSQMVLTNVLTGTQGIREVSLTVTPTADRPLPPDGTPVVDVEAFVQGRLIGGFRKIFRPPVPIHRPKDPMYAESEIFIQPYPPRAREPTEIGVEIRNPTPEPQIITVTFSYANFGIGLPFRPIHTPLIVTVPPDGVIRPVIVWLPPDSGLWCIQVALQLTGHDQPFISQRNIDVGEPLEPNTPHARPFLVGNPFQHPVTITLGLIPHFPDWGLELSQDVLPNVLPGLENARTVVLTVTPPADLPVDGDPIVDVEAFVEGELIGGFRKIFRPPVPVHRPRDPIYAESEIGVDPYPIVPGQPVELSVEVFNPTDEDRIVTTTFSIAPFGIGLPFSTTHIAPNPIRIFVPAHGAARGHVVWQPPRWRGKFCVRVTLEAKGHDPIWSQRNIDVGEPLRPGEPHTLIFPVGSWPHTRPVTITLGLINHRDGWDAKLSQTELANVQPDQKISVTLTVTPPNNVELGTGEPIVDVEAFVDGRIIGGFRKLDRPPVPIHKPHEKGYAESEIGIDPYPPQMGQEVRVSTAVQNASEKTMTVDLAFGWAKFGMGIPFSTTGMMPYTRSLTLGPEMTSTAWVSWTPTMGGPQCVRILLSDPNEVYGPQESQRNVDVIDQPPCGLTEAFTFTVRNDTIFTATVDIGLITFNVPEPWVVTTIPSDTLDLGPDTEGTITVTVHIPCPVTLQTIQNLQQIQALQQQAGSVPTIDVEAYSGGDLLGGIELRFEGEEKRYIYLPIILNNQ